MLFAYSNGSILQRIIKNGHMDLYLCIKSKILFSYNYIYVLLFILDVHVLWIYYKCVT